jgi:hypothetical protein
MPTESAIARAPRSALAQCSKKWRAVEIQVGCECPCRGECPHLAHGRIECLFLAQAGVPRRAGADGRYRHVSMACATGLFVCEFLTLGSAR